MSFLYRPEDYGAEIVAECDVREPDYSFDIVAVFRSLETGALWGAFDSGCSCPTPFEDFARLEDMTPIRSVADAEGLPDMNMEWSGDKQAFLAKVRAALRVAA